MKKILKVSLIFVLILAMGISAFVWWQWDNIKAVYVMLNYSSEEIDTFVLDNESEINRLLKDITPIEMRPLNDEEMKKLSSGEITDEEAIDIIKKGDGNNESSNSKVDDIIAGIYLLRAEYINALSSLESEAISSAKAISPKDRTVGKKLELIELYTGKGVALEAQCDSRMDSLLMELETELKKEGKKTDIVSQIRSVYASEKQSKKSQLFGKYLK